MPKPMLFDPSAKRISFAQLDREDPVLADAVRAIAEAEGVAPQAMTILKRGEEYSAVTPFRKNRDFEN